MDEIEKAIRFFESDIEMNPLFTCKVNPDKTIDYVALAIQALQEKAERDNPQPLTLEQLKERVDKPVYEKLEQKGYVIDDFDTIDELLSVITI